ncbi:drug/metabolite transporter (DMT)-like permease [Clostridium saccharoperbutylacetonicum]|jgi:drug/metabolite transporter (DMT)-like permease|uniref:DMT superfamily permease n=1 Tax=Clostridium saccharoperbutylacetonicum N1-4(HMT) TaxID=931276 RepID=M1MDH1_9CLOT|nr:DMT family transporter [Clostridium saccharoperbutylacetonicum]AGF54443.1 DMT superfamily permease [Clostridium saccharoperbutylacetonicum N1-4(HMT)]NRT59038.1 drug/metabolite transporter (DMT)-like permease [Clostridium saccharoperbutylacetonicum]NSB28226.1 drug/metabolite transporter (DMT)-like permease [Clostridium saccharoperbutylacetonicum]NSB41714.1 drug/metabolite transporter (DMT)-like permease [Clostridium saccharoperbutylacetonicum]
MDKTKFYTNRKNIVFLAALCCLLWGSAYPAIKVGYELFNVNDVGSKLVFAGYRFTLAGIFIILLEMIRRKSIISFTKKQFGQITLLGVTQTTLQYIFFYVGLSYTTGVRGSIINGTGTFISIILAHFIYKNDKLNFNKIAGCIIGFLGVIIVNLNGQSLGGSSFTFKGEGFVMIAAIIFAGSAIYGKRVTQDQEPAVVTGFQLFIGGIILTILGFTLGGGLEGFTIKSTVLLIYMALLSSVAFAVWTELLKYNKVGIISVFNFLVPIFGTLLSAIFLGENIFDIKILIALILVCYGIFLVYKVKKEPHKEVATY